MYVNDQDMVTLIAFGNVNKENCAEMTVQQLVSLYTVAHVAWLLS